MMFIVVKVKYVYDVHVKMGFVLTWTIQFNIWILLGFFNKFLAHMWLEVWKQFTNSKCKVVSLLWFAHSNMRICKGAQLLTCSHYYDLLDHIKHSTHFLGEFDWSKSLFWRDENVAFPCAPLSSFVIT